MSLETYWLVVPIVGLCITIPVWLWLRLTRPGRRQHGRRPAEWATICSRVDQHLPQEHRSAGDEPDQRARHRRHRPHEPEKIEPADWRGDIGGAEMTLRTKPVPMTGG
jgi:hypothetical protein